MKIDSSYSPIDIAISGLKAMDKNIKTISSNVANARSTDNGNGEPYRRIETIFKTDGKGIAGVTVDRVAEDMSDFKQMLKPGHPDADENGNVSMPNVQVPIEMMNLNIAARTYQANTAILKRYQQMVETTLELLK